ncbi:receptor-type tyrosine-protein phosphatase alpha-like isoform X2 [Argopecten irradians]|uniref:receptor-type tyrosine-protein phosphatase alpha-like isoform X2 n=1 Tax=Argopecten irradians TaxID=31199 RepID=UPI0037167B43
MYFLVVSTIITQRRIKTEMSSRNGLRYWEISLVMLFFVQTTRSEINVALSGTATQSSDQELHRWLAPNAIDNCTNQNISSNCCIHTKTNTHKQAWWRVDLGLERTIQRITIYYRHNSEYRFGGYSLYVSNSTTIPPQGTLCYEDNSSVWTGVSLNPTHECPSVGRYVIVYNKRETPKTRDWYDDYAVLELCEVQVFGCPTGIYGIGNCNTFCSASCFGGNCNALSGHCFYCEDGKYGDLCQQTCVANCNQRCEKDSGRCIGCVTGKTGDVCNGDCPANCVSCSQSLATNCFECIDGKHGEACQFDCSPNCRDETCIKDNGYCLGECVDGKYGNTCEIDCPSGCQGNTCNKTNGYCSACIRGKRGNRCEDNCPSRCMTCSQLSNECYECISGKYGPVCSQNCLGTCKNNICQRNYGNCTDCPAGKYGNLCDKDCSANCLNDECNIRSGVCEGCKKRYFGQDCNSQCEPECKICGQSNGICTECTDSLYGANCSIPCGNCERCRKDTGECLSMCAAGYEGNTCMARIMPPSSDSTGTIVGVLVGILVLVVIIIVILLIIRRRRQNSAKDKPFECINRNGQSHSFHHNGINDESNNTNVYSEPEPEAKYVKETKTGEGHVYINANDVTKDEHPGSVYANTDIDDCYYNAVDPGTAISELKTMVKTKMLNKAKVFEDEYKALPTGDLHANKIGMKSENKSKNRFKTTFPYDHSRVVLDKVDKDSNSDYINANYIDGVSLPAEYIATQGPIDKTIDDFWRMIWQLQSGKIVMLTNLVEGTKKKCAKYWPDEGEPMVTKHFSIVQDRERVYAFYVIRDITITEKKTKSTRQIHQFHYTTWPDHGTPDPNELVVFHRRVIKYKNSLPGKMVVHCSAGIGRTGTFIALDALWKHGRQVGAVDVNRYIKTMRKDRVNMVQTSEQYIALHHILIEAFDLPDTLVSREKFHTTLTSLQSGSPENQTKLRQEYQLTQDLKPIYTADDCRTGSLPANGNKNRDQKSLPVDKFRVYLNSPAQGSTDYINAVEIPSYTSRNGYIVTQNPLQNTVVDLLTMIMDYDCDTVVIIENDNLEWLPEKDSEKSHGGFVIKHEADSSSLSKTDITDFIISNKEHKYESRVRVFHMSAWDKEALIPQNSQGLLQLLEIVDSRRKSNQSKQTVVMCRDGYSQSGLFCCISNARDQIKTDEEVDIFQIVRQLLFRRPEFVTCYDQYQCCYNTIRDYLDTTDVYMN